MRIARLNYENDRLQLAVCDRRKSQDAGHGQERPVGLTGNDCNHDRPAHRVEDGASIRRPGQDRKRRAERDTLSAWECSYPDVRSVVSKTKHPALATPE